MSTRNFLEAGIDLSLLSSDATNAQILQAIRESRPASGLGFLIYQSATPDVSTYTEYVTFIWINTATGELKYWNGTSWQLISGAAVIANNTVTIGKLSAAGGAAFQLIRVNTGMSAFEFINPADIFAAGGLPIDRLAVAPASGYVLYSTGGGAWTTSLLTALINNWLAATLIDISRVADVSGSGLPNQVAYIADTFNSLEFGYPDQLLRANQVDTNRLKFAAGAAGKYVKVNAGGTDFEYGSVPLKAATLKYTVAKNGAAQAVSITTETVVEWNTVVDTESAISSFDSATDRITLATGTYLLDITVPVYNAAANLSGVLLLYDVTGSTIVGSVSFKQTGDVDSQFVNLLCTVKVTAASNVYDVRIYSSQAIALGNPANLASYTETYQQMSVTKLS